MDGLVLGAALAGIAMFPGGLKRLYASAGIALVLGTLGGAFMLWHDPMVLFSESSMGMQTVGYTLLSVFFASLMVRVLVAPKSFLGRVFESPVLAFFGKYSYCLYLVHEPVN
jgi:peptidoglycan/LPS O-acetylase OafA/YrhL